MSDMSGMDNRTAPRAGEHGYFVGFENHCRTYLAPVVRNGASVPPNPDAVRKILKDERPSRKMLLNVFANAPELLGHPLASEDVRTLYVIWRSTGAIPEEYGRGVPPKCARDVAGGVPEGQVF